MLEKAKKGAAAVALAAGMVGVMFLGGPAFADDPAPTVETAVGSGFTSTGALITGVIAGAFFALLLTVIGIRVGAKWLKRGANQ